MGQKMKNDKHTPSVCIIDDSPTTVKLYNYLFSNILMNPMIFTFTHPMKVNIENFKTCDLIVIDEIMEGMTGTQFLHDVIVNHFQQRFHDFPNVIFISSLDMGDMHERIKAYGLDHLIPSYRVLEKPVTPIEIKNTLLSICPTMEHHVAKKVLMPNSELPWKVAMSKAFHEIFGLKEPKSTSSQCFVSI